MSTPHQQPFVTFDLVESVESSLRAIVESTHISMEVVAVIAGRLVRDDDLQREAQIHTTASKRARSRRLASQRARQRKKLSSKKSR